MEILNLKDLNIIKGYFKQELHPRARDGKFAKKHEGIVSPVVREEPKKASKTSAKAKPKASTPKKDTKSKTTPKKTAPKKPDPAVKVPDKKTAAKKVAKPKEAKKFYRYSPGASSFIEAVGAKEVKLKAVKGSFFMEHPDPEHPEDTYIYETTTGTRIISCFTGEKDAIKMAESRLKGWGQEYFEDRMSTNKMARGLAPGHENPKKVAKPAAKTKEATAPKMPPVVDDLVKKRVPRPKVVLLPKTSDSEFSDLAPDFQNKGRVRVIARRVGSYAVPNMQVNSREDVAQVFADLTDSDREKSYVLGTKNGEVVGIHCAHIGNVDSSIIDPKDMMKVPLLSGADTVYLIHNHPTGDSTPSQPDVAVTERFRDVADHMGMRFGGHVVIGDNEYTALNGNGSIVEFNKNMDRSKIMRTEQAPIYETYQEKDASVPGPRMNGVDDVKDYIKNNLSIHDADKAIYIIGVDTKNGITHAEPLDVTLSPNKLRKKALESLIKANSKSFFMYTGFGSSEVMHNAGIQDASKTLGIQLYDVIVPNTNSRQDIDAGHWTFRSYAERSIMNLVKGLYIDLQKALAPGKVTKTQAKALHKELPPGGVWRSMNGHHIYILNGKVLAGAIPGVKSAKKATKAHLAEHQETIDKEAKAAAKLKKLKARRDPAGLEGKKPTTKTGKEAIEDTLKEVNNKESSTKRTKVTPEFMAKQKEAVDALAKKPKPKSKKATLEEQQAEAKKMLEPTTKPKDKAKEILNSKNDKQDKIIQAASELTEAKRATDKVIKRKGVNDIRTEKQANNETAYDVGAKIGGARKDVAVFDAFLKSLSGQSLGDVEKMSPEQAQKLCVKKNLLKPVDFEADYKRGVDINVAITKQLIYDRITPKPSDDTPEARAGYLHAIKELQRQLEPVTSWDEFKKATRNLGDWMKAETPKNMGDQQRYLEYAQKQYEKEPTEDDLKERVYTPGSDVKWVTLTRDEWKKKKLDRVNDVKRDIEFAKKTAQSPYAPLGEKLTNFFTNYESRDRTMQTVASKNMTWDKYISKQKEASEAHKEEKGAKTKTKWEKMMPAKIQRSGGRDTKVQKPEEMVKTFGFKGIEFGNWVDDKSGNFHLVKCAEAFHDLADILGLQDKDVSMNGRLSMAFGARGKGKALAHYEALSKAINITKEGGAGSLAHEWGHAMDNILYQESAGRNSTNLASEGMGDVGDKRIKASYEVLMDAILKGDGSGIEYVDNKDNDYYSYYPKRRQAVADLGIAGAVLKYSKELDSARDRALSSTEDWAQRYNYDKAKKEKEIKKILRKHTTDKNAMVQEMAYHHKKLTGEVLDKIPVPNGMSQFYTDSKNVGGDTDYWISNCELFARAFETYVESKMRTGKIKNDYLVHGSWYDTKSTPYPKGKERDAINGAFDELMKNVRNSGAIQKGLSFDLQKGIIGRSDLQRPVIPITRSAYNVANTEGILYIPTNRLQTPFQTDKALDFDKVRSNVTRMENGENIDPIIIGWNYEVHDGHHKLEASKIQGYTHCPCIIGEFNGIDKQRLFEEYSELWKSFREDYAEPKKYKTRSLKTDIETTDLDGEKKAIIDYSERLKQIKDPRIRKILVEIIADEKNHKHNLAQVLSYLNGDKTALNSNKLQKSLVYLPEVDTGLSAFPYDNASGIMFRGIGQKEYDFIQKSGYIQTKGKGNDADQENVVTCFSTLFSQAEGYARSNYDLYNETMAYVLVVEYRGVENELGEIEVLEKTPASSIFGVIPVPKTPVMKGLYIDLKKSITRSEAKKVHKDLPEGGVWRTLMGHHVYIKDGKILAGSVPGVKGVKKATKEHLAGHQKTIDKEAKKAVPKANEVKGLVQREVGQLDRGMTALAKGKKLRAKLGDIHSSEDTYNAYARKVSEYKDRLGTDPHKLTYGDFYSTAREYQGFIGSDEMPLNALAKMNRLPNNGLRRELELHYNFVKRALEEGKEVPPEVLKDYPELVSVHKSEKPVYDKAKGEGTSKTKGVDAKMGSRLSATNAKKLMGEYGVPAGHREAVLNTLKHSTTSNSFSAQGRDELDVTGSKQVIGREYSAVDVQKAVESYKKDKKFAKDVAAKAIAINDAAKQEKKAKSDAKAQKELEHDEFLETIKANTDQMYKDQETREAKKNRTPEQVAADEKAFADFDPLALLMAGTEPNKEPWEMTPDEYFHDKMVKTGYMKGAQGEYVGVIHDRYREHLAGSASLAQQKEWSDQEHKKLILKHHAETTSMADAFKEFMDANKPKEEPKIAQYYKSNKSVGDRTGKLTYVPVDGKRIDIGGDVHAFIHKGAGGRGWVITEVRSGIMLANGKTQDETMVKAREAVTKLGPTKLAEGVKKHIDKHGESPATAEPGKAGTIFGSEQPVTPYHIAVPKGKNGKAKYTPVHNAEKVNVGKGIHAFIHGREGDWAVSEARSGLKITSNSSKNLAVKIAKELIERNRENLDTMIQKHIEKHGESPKTAPTFDEYVKKEVKGSTDHLSVEAWGSYRRSYDSIYNGKR